MITTIVVFGDELCLDTGQSAITYELQLSQDDERIEGQIAPWIQQVQDHFKVKVISYAQKGATTLPYSRSFTKADNSILTQLDIYLDQARQLDHAETLFLISSAFTDAFNVKGITAEETVNATQMILAALKELGADTTAVVVPYSLTRIPRTFHTDISEDELHRLSFYSFQTSHLFKQNAIKTIDLYDLFNNIMNCPDDYGLKGNIALRLEQDDILFEDEIHASQLAQGFIAQKAIEALNGFFVTVTPKKLVKASSKDVQHSDKLLHIPTLPSCIDFNLKRPGSPGSRTL